ncbi:hypothetical protein [Streptomyces hypolithicus]
MSVVLLVPAAMTLLGKWAWWTPRLLDRLLPHVDADGVDAEEYLSPVSRSAVLPGRRGGRPF